LEEKEGEEDLPQRKRKRKLLLRLNLKILCKQFKKE
jgi:hypothetical protein